VQMQYYDDTVRNTKVISTGNVGGVVCRLLLCAMPTGWTTGQSP